MKIAGTTQVISVYKKAATQAARTIGGIVPQQKDTIEVSNNAMSFSEVMRAAKADITSAASAERLSALEQSVNAGTYYVDARELAARMLVNMGA